MGLLWRLLAPKPLKKARRTVRKATRPVRTATRAITPRPVKKLQRAAHPLDLAELKIEDAAVRALRGKPKQKQSAVDLHGRPISHRSRPRVMTTGEAAAKPAMMNGLPGRTTVSRLHC